MTYWLIGRPSGPGYPWIDTVYSALNLTVSIMIIQSIYEDNHAAIDRLRHMEAITASIIWVKSLYFLELFDEISPLVKSIFKMFEDVFYFTLILILAMFSFAFSYFLLGLLLGRNQQPATIRQVQKYS